MKKQISAASELNQVAKDQSLNDEIAFKKIKVLTLLMDDDFMAKIVAALKSRYGKISLLAAKNIDELKNKASVKKYDLLIIKGFDNEMNEEITSLIISITSKHPQTRVLLLTDEITMPMFYYINYWGGSGVFTLQDTTPKSLGDMLTKDLKDQILYTPREIKC